MSADYNTFITIRGTQEVIAAVLRVLKSFNDERDVYFSCVRVSSDRKELFFSAIDVLDLSDQEIEEFSKTLKGELFIDCDGPWGKFGMPDETRIFEEMAEAAPMSYYSADISGFDSGGRYIYEGELKDQLLHMVGQESIYGFDEDDRNEDGEPVYHEYCDITYDPVAEVYTSIPKNTESRPLSEMVEFILNNKEKLPLNRGFHLYQAITTTMPYKVFLETAGFDKETENKKQYYEFSHDLIFHGER